ncbi:MAG: hypothetical protein CVU52_06150 [Deltaproteobacteria bacterium HGW-Deltaproteobacteria-10]|nr:MAG: hypothetical protein CVU52_06150 [Deltaproteobacteria bacterium HGW-Deltaproteobacteria-10]
MNLSRWITPIAGIIDLKKRKDRFSKQEIYGLLGIIILLSFLFSLILSGYNLITIPEYRVGDIARTNVIVPADVLITDKEATRLRKAEAKAGILPVYRFDQSIIDERIFRLASAFSKSRILWNAAENKFSHQRKHKPKFQLLSSVDQTNLRAIWKAIDIATPTDDLLKFLVKERFNASLEGQLVTLLRHGFSVLIISDDRKIIRDKSDITMLDTVTGKEVIVPLARILTLKQAKDMVNKKLSLDVSISASSKPKMSIILDSLLAPNLRFDLKMTQAKQTSAAENTDPVLRQLKKGKVILRQGDEVGHDQLTQIDAIRKFSAGRASIEQIVSTSIIIAFLLAIYAFFLRLLNVGQWHYFKLLLLSGLVLTFNLLLLKVFWFVCDSISRNFVLFPFSEKDYFFYSLPYAWGAMNITLLAGEQCAQIFLLFYVVLAGQIVGTDYYGLFYILIINLIGILVVRKATQRIGIIGSGFKLGLIAVFMFMVLQTAKQVPLDMLNIGLGAVLAFLSGLVNAAILTYSLPLCERLFKVTTEIRLSELGNLNNPLIRELILKAPGTYNHSIAVGTLAEGAAKAVGISPLFLRVASLYHDIGKTVQPEYFVENQQKINPHDHIAAKESVSILRCHVNEGIKLAREANLPPSIVDLIPQHHGTRLMQFFFEKARQNAGGSTEVKEDDFRYTGPKPQTKAAAILMLSDGIEAAARTLSEHSQDKLLDLIQKIIASAGEDGQFTECDISLADIDRITFSFLETLLSYYHSRIDYPGFNFNRS